MDADNLRRMIEEDEFGLLKIKVNAPVLTEAERVLMNFKEVEEFVRLHDREPALSPSNMGEFQLAARLQALRDDPEQREALKEHDEMSLLVEAEPPSSLADALASDSAGLLDSGDADLLAPTHVPKVTSMPDQVARREKCEDFADFEPLFVACQADLRTGKREMKQFRNEQQIRAGAFYVQKGVLVYVAKVGQRERKGGKFNARLRCIYENGTESGILLRSLSAELYKDGKLVTEPADEPAIPIELDPDTPMATVYVLRSLSTDPQVTAIPNLHKIGSTKQTVEKRIASAAKETTFLDADVEVIARYGVPAWAEKKIEGLLHTFFNHCRLDVWFEHNGIPTAQAREWFSVPVPQIDEAINLINSGAITEYTYDREAGEMRLLG
jgi:hypothetical protein